MWKRLCFVTMLAGCTSSPPANCVGAGKALCKKAADCAGDGGGAILFSANDAGMPTGWGTFGTELSCEQAVDALCSIEGGTPIDWYACANGVANATCRSWTDFQDATIKGVAEPTACGGP
jgi:hypothetical protein